MNKDKPTKLTWQLPREHNIHAEVTLHAIGKSYTPNSAGIYCYYIYIHESVCAEGVFDKLWLEDKLYRFLPEMPERVIHNYFDLEMLNEVEFHHGITYYDKRGHSVGHRCVVVGCDYNHLWDNENPPVFETVCNDAIATRNQIANYIKK